MRRTDGDRLDGGEVEGKGTEGKENPTYLGEAMRCELELGGGLRIEMDRFGFALPKKEQKTQRKRVGVVHSSTLYLSFYFISLFSPSPV